MDSLNTFIKNTINNLTTTKWTIGKIIKTALLAIVALIALSLVLSVFKWVLGIDGHRDYRHNNFSIEQAFEEPEMLLDMVRGPFEAYGEDDHMMQDGDMMDKSLSMKMAPRAPRGLMGGNSLSNMMISESVSIPMPEMVPASKDAEDFETREYSASYEESNVSSMCNKFEALKPLEYVVFENANQSDTYCNYRFKVEQDRENEIITIIKALNPKDFNARTFTLERNITNNNNEVAILEKKLKMLDSLLSSAQEKYAKLRTTGNTNALVQAINNEINLIERITNQKLNVQSRIDRLTDSTGVQTERIDYSQFNVSVSERKFINWSNIGDSWKYALERFITGVSTMVQGMTIGLVMFVLKLVKFIIFLSVGVITVVSAAKFLLAIIKKIWRG